MTQQQDKIRALWIEYEFAQKWADEILEMIEKHKKHNP